jgi:hypothetical protein
MFRSLGILSTTVVTLFVYLPAAAHHANSAYDRTESVTIAGTVTRWQFINPHAGLWLTFTDENGDTQEWSGEFQGTLDLYRHFSWNKDTFKAGDEITITGYPSRDGTANLSARIVKFADGSEVDVRSAPD